MFSIQSISSFEQIPFFDLASPQTCVLIDLDDTVFVESLAIMRNTNKTQRAKFLEAIHQEGGDEKITFLYDNMKYELIEESVLDLLNTSGLQSMGFTAKRTGRATSDQVRHVEDKTLCVLKDLNVSFDKSLVDNMSFPDMNPSNKQYDLRIVDNTAKPFVLPNGVVVKDGVVFCNDIDKGLVLETIFEHFNTPVDKICIIDDRLKNLYDVAASCSKLGLMFVGYHYKGADLLDNDINMNAVNIQRMNLVARVPTIVPDAQATLICLW